MNQVDPKAGGSHEVKRLEMSLHVDEKLNLKKEGALIGSNDSKGRNTIAAIKGN